MRQQQTSQVRREGYGRWTERDDGLFAVLGLGEYDDQQPVGRWSYWYETGQREGDGLWVAGKKHGRWIHWTLEGGIDEKQSGIYSGGHRVRVLSVVEKRRMAVREGTLERCVACGSIKADRLAELGWDTSFFPGSDRDGALCKWCALAATIFKNLDRHMTSLELVGVMETMDLVGSEIEHIYGAKYSENLERLRDVQEAHDNAVTKDWRRLHQAYLRDTYGDEETPLNPSAPAPEATERHSGRLVRLFYELGWGPRPAGTQD
jgi:hypothetical protein